MGKGSHMLGLGISEDQLEELVDIDNFIDSYLQEFHARSLDGGASALEADVEGGGPFDFGPSREAGFGSLPDTYEAATSPSLQDDSSGGTALGVPTASTSPVKDEDDADTEGRDCMATDRQGTSEDAEDGTADDQQRSAGKTKAQLLQEKNRRAQRRFRERQKSKVTELEQKVADLASRLQAALADKAQLESRNQVLVHVLQIRDQQIEQLRAQANGLGHPEVIFKEPLTVTNQDGQQITLTPDQVKKLSHDDLATIWKQYVNQLSVFLMELERQQESQAITQRITQLTNEACILVMRVAISNPLVSKSWVVSKMDDIGDEHREMWLLVVRSLGLSDAQKISMVEVRRLFLENLAPTAVERAGILRAMSSNIPSAGLTRQNAVQFLKAHDSLQRLKENLKKEHLLVLDFVSTLLKHTLTPLQAARTIIRSYPWCPDTLAMCTWVAAELGDQDASLALQASPSSGSLAASALAVLRDRKGADEGEPAPQSARPTLAETHRVLHNGLSTVFGSSFKRKQYGFFDFPNLTDTFGPKDPAAEASYIDSGLPSSISSPTSISGEQNSQHQQPSIGSGASVPISLHSSISLGAMPIPASTTLASHIPDRPDASRLAALSTSGSALNSLPEQAQHQELGFGAGKPGANSRWSGAPTITTGMHGRRN